MNFYLLMRTFDPLGQLLWLQRELEASETIDEDVFIIMHIPLGTDFAIAKWNDVFNALMERFANTVVSLFSGHTHSDHLKFLTQSDDKSKVYMQNFIGNSLTTYSNYEPSFRVFKVDSDTN
jgi:sphingomyelin phosphodiesterase